MYRLHNSYMYVGCYSVLNVSFFTAGNAFQIASGALYAEKGKPQKICANLIAVIKPP